ncbi:MAG: DNA polymerase domain-containing protein [Verrucomicrobiota bacterium]
MQQISLDNIAESRWDRLVACEVNRIGTVTLFRREADGAVTTEDVEFGPWLLVDGELPPEAWGGSGMIEPLEGDGAYTRRLRFADTEQYFDALKALRKHTGYTPSRPDAPYRVFSDLEQQALMDLPARLFRGMQFADVRRMQIDLETYTTPGFEFPSAERAGDRILLISLRDSTGWEHCLSGHRLDEKAMLEELVRLVAERDPDILEGHNIFNFDLPYLDARARRHAVSLDLGRAGRRIRSRSSRFSAGEYSTTYTRYDVYGRHVVDTMHLARLYDVSHRVLESVSLKSVAKHFGVAAADRTYVRGDAISALFDSDPERLEAYAMDDVRETDSISALLSPSYFHQAQIVPFSHQNCVTRGNAARIDAMLNAAYLRRNGALPKPGEPHQFAGGLTASPRTGVFRNVWHADVRSLYPSILISRKLNPANDRLGIFLDHLERLRTFRLAAKDACRNAESAARRDHYDALQSTFKILINSFYGYLGFAQGTFNDFDVAEKVTAIGREILQGMIDFLEQQKAKVIELDTDGIYFVPPDDVSETEEMRRRIQQTLPEGIDIELDSTFEAMFSYKSKNYALLEHDGTVSVTGAALKSRGLEPFQRQYIHEFLVLVLQGRQEQVEELFERYKRQLAEHRFPHADLAKRETLSMSPATYREKLDAGKTRRSAAYELVLTSERDYRQGDQVIFYVTGNKKSVSVTENSRLLGDADATVRDENTAYYIDKLTRLHKKLVSALDDSTASG